MTTPKPGIDEFIEQVRRIDWMSAPPPTREAEQRLREYTQRLGVLARHFKAARGWTLIETDTHLVAVGMHTAESTRLIGALFQATAGVRVKEHLVFNLHAYYFWDTDPELAAFENPFEPLFDLYEQGYTTAGGVADDGGPRLEMTLGSRAGITEYVMDIDGL